MHSYAMTKCPWPKSISLFFVVVGSSVSICRSISSHYRDSAERSTLYTASQSDSRMGLCVLVVPLGRTMIVKEKDNDS